MDFRHIHSYHTFLASLELGLQCLTDLCRQTRDNSKLLENDNSISRVTFGCSNDDNTPFTEEQNYRQSEGKREGGKMNILIRSGELIIKSGRKIIFSISVVFFVLFVLMLIVLWSMYVGHFPPWG